MPEKQSTEIATTAGGNLMSSTRFEPKGLEELKEVCTWIADSGLCPDDVETSQDVMVIAMKGATVGLSVMEAMQEVHVIKGRPKFSAKLKISLARQHPECEYFKIVEWSDELCTYETKREGHEPQQYTFTIEDAKRAMPKKFVEPQKEWKRSNWLKYPDKMLRARAGAGLAEAVYDEIMVGLYSPEEIESAPMNADGVEVVGGASTDPNEKYGGTDNEVVDAEFEEANDEEDDTPDRSSLNRSLGQLVAGCDDLDTDDKPWIRDALLHQTGAEDWKEIPVEALEGLVDEMRDADGSADDGQSDRAALVESWLPQEGAEGEEGELPV